MTDAEIICEWMEPKPKNLDSASSHGIRSPLGFWITGGRSHRDWGWYAFLAERCASYQREFLGLLREVEERLTDEQWVAYIAAVLLGTYDDLTGTHQRLLHATAGQKIKALAAVRRAALAAVAVLKAGIRTPVEGEKP